MAARRKDKGPAKLFVRQNERKKKYNLPFVDTGLAKLLKTKNDITFARGDERLYECITLDNKLEVLLIQENSKSVKNAACALTVDVGSFSNPPEMPGLAHLLEHMMFLGSGGDGFEPGEFSRFVNAAGGFENAYTAHEETNYHFQVPYAEKVFEGAIARLTASFINPGFTAEGIKNESEVVDNEYVKNLGHPFWELRELLGCHSNKKHPFSKFAIGNFETLYTKPMELSLDIPEFLTDFFHKHYSANRMKAVLVAPCSLSKLKSLARKYFSRIVNFDSRRESFPGSPFKDTTQKRFDVIAKSDDKIMTLIFPLENFTRFELDLPADFVAAAISSRDPGCLWDYLENQGWVDSIKAYTRDVSRDCRLFHVSIVCTESGIWDHVDDILHAFFHFVDKIYRDGLKAEYIDQIAKEKGEDFSRTFYSPYETAQSVASNMLETQREHYLTYGSVVNQYDHDAFLRVCESLVPDKLHLAISHKGAEAEADQEEYYFKAKYAVSDLPREMIEKLKLRDKKFFFKVPQEKKKVSDKYYRPIYFDPPTIADVEEEVNLPKKLLESCAVTGKAPVFVVVHEPSAALFGEKKKNVKTEGGMATLNDVKSKEGKSFVERGVVLGRRDVVGGPKAEPTRPFGGMATVEGIDDKKNANKVYMNELVVPAEDVGTIVDFDPTKLYAEPYYDEQRPPVLLKATSKGLLFFKQQSTNARNFGYKTTVKINLYPAALKVSTLTARDQLLLRLYLSFASSSLLRYKNKVKREFGASISFASTEGSIIVTLSGFEANLLDLCREILDEMTKTQNFKWHRFETYKKGLIQGEKKVRDELLEVCASHMHFFSDEDMFMYDELSKAAKGLKLSDCQVFAENLMFGCTMQTLVFGNCKPDTAVTMFDRLSNSLKASIGKIVRNPFPQDSEIVFEEGKEAFYVESTEQIFSDMMYEFRTYKEDKASAFHCRLQVHPVSLKQRAVLGVLGVVMKSPCFDFIRTKERVGYLVHSQARIDDLTASLDFTFQSNTFGPFQMNEKLEAFLLEFIEEVRSLKSTKLMKSKRGFNSKLMQPSQSSSGEASHWNKMIRCFDYNFGAENLLADQVWKVTKEDLVEILEEFILPGAPHRRKMVTGVVGGPHFEADEEAKAKLSENESVIIVQDPHDFKLDNELLRI